MASTESPDRDSSPEEPLATQVVPTGPVSLDHDSLDVDTVGSPVCDLCTDTTYRIYSPLSDPDPVPHACPTDGFPLLGFPPVRPLTSESCTDVPSL